MKYLSSLADIKIVHSDLKRVIEFKDGKFDTKDKKEAAVIENSNLFGVSIWEDKELNPEESQE